MATTSKRGRRVLDFPLRLDEFAGNQSLQVHASLRSAILDGRLTSGLRLPSTRALADQIGIRRNAVVCAYEHLQSDGLVEARMGAGTYVASLVATRQKGSKIAPIFLESTERKAFSLGKTYADASLLHKFASVLRRRIIAADESILGYGDPRGSEALRRQVALNLASRRGIMCDPSCIVVVSGTQQGLRLCAEALLHPGDSVWMEDPGYPVAGRTMTAAGLRLIPVPVDGEGIDVAAGQRLGGDARAAYITPSHQFPTGVTMSMARRSALLEWARSSNTWLFEDDYDSEFRYGGPPLTALAGIGGSDRVIYFGTFSKTLFAGLRVAYVVLPPAAVEPFIRARATHDRFPPSFTAAAIAELMADGTLDDHTRRMRRRYRLARDAVASALADSAAGCLRIVVPPQGLHLLAYLPPGLPGDAAECIRGSAKVEAWLLSETRLIKDDVDGFVLGFAGHEISELIAAATALGQAAKLYIVGRHRS